jgi:hypothetical protein
MWQRIFRAADAECDAQGVTHPARAAAEQCVQMRARIEAGDGGAVLDAIAVCAAHELPLPHWLADEFLRRYSNVARGQARDWNDDRAFGLAYPRGTNIAGVRARVEDAPAAYGVAVQLLEADPARPIDAGFYEAVGDRVGVGKTRAYELLKMHEGYPLTDVRAKLSAGLSLRQAFRELADERFRREYRPDPGN